MSINNSILLMMGASQDVVTAPTDYVGFWLLDANALDSSGNGNDATAYNVTYDGEYAVMTGATTNSYLLTNIALTAFTYSAWFRIDGAMNSFANFYYNYLHESTSGAQSLSYQSGNININGVQAIASSLTWATGHIYHVTMTRSNTQGYPIVTIYDKTDDVSETLHFTLVTATNFDAFTVIAGVDTNNALYTNMSVSNIRLYDYIISDDEILAIRADEIAQHT